MILLRDRKFFDESFCMTLDEADTTPMVVKRFHDVNFYHLHIKYCGLTPLILISLIVLCCDIDNRM